jgi:hypothetical protein
MSTRNSDASQLTLLKQSRTQAAFFNQRRTLQNAAQTGVFVAQVNPQTGVDTNSRILNYNDGNYTTYYRASPATIVSVPCDCADAAAKPTANENVPVQQPVNAASPQQ